MNWTHTFNGRLLFTRRTIDVAVLSAGASHLNRFQHLSWGKLLESVCVCELGMYCGNRRTQTHFTRHIQRCWTNDKYEMWMRQRPYRSDEAEKRRCTSKGRRVKSILVRLLHEFVFIVLLAPVPHGSTVLGVESETLHSVNPSDEKCRERKVYRCRFRWNSRDVSTRSTRTRRQHKRNNDSFVVRREKCARAKQRTTSKRMWKTHTHTLTNNWERNGTKENTANWKVLIMAASSIAPETFNSVSSLFCLASYGSMADAYKLCSSISLAGMEAPRSTTQIDEEKIVYELHEVGIRLHNSVQSNIKRRIRIPHTLTDSYVTRIT